MENIKNKKIVICPVHGDVTASVLEFETIRYDHSTSAINDSHRVFCAQCLLDLLTKNLPECEVKEVESDGNRK